MSQKMKQTAARVYVEGAPGAIHLQLPYENRAVRQPGGGDEAIRVYMTQDELRARIRSQLEDGQPLDYRQTDGSWVLIPAGRVVDVVLPDMVVPQGPESGMDEDQRNAEAQLDAHGNVEAAIGIADREFVESYLANRAFDGDTVVLTSDGWMGTIVGARDGVFSVEGTNDNSGAFTIDGIVKVLCWNLEDYTTTGDSVMGQFTSAGLSAGPGTVLDATGQRMKTTR